PRQKRELEAIERHTGSPIAPWIEGAHVAPTKVESRKPRRHSKPHVTRNGDEDYTRLIANAGRAGGVEVRDIVNVITHQAGLDGEAVRDVRVLERFSLVSVPADEAE